MTFLDGDPLTDMNPAGTLAAEGHNDRHNEVNEALRELRTDRGTYVSFVTGLGGTATENAAAIQAKLDAAVAAERHIVMLPGGTIEVDAILTIPSGVTLMGQGHAATILKLADSTDLDVVRSEDFGTLWGSGNWLTADGVPYGFGLVGLSIDGNKANNSSGRGVSFFGKNYTVDDVIVRDCAQDGFFSEAGSATGQNDWTDLPETYIDNLWCRNNGGKGFHFRGPHNATIGKVVSAYNGDWGAYFDADTDFDGNCDQVGMLHTYANADDKGVYLGAVVHATRIVTDGDNLQVDASGCTISQVKCLNGGGVLDAIHLTSAAVFTQIAQVNVSMTAPSGATHRRAVHVESTQSQINDLRLSGNSTSNHGLVLAGGQNQIGTLLAKEFSGASSVGLDLSGNDQRIVNGHITNCATGIAYTPGLRNAVRLGVFTASGQTPISGTPDHTDLFDIVLSGDVEGTIDHSAGAWGFPHTIDPEAATASVGMSSANQARFYRVRDGGTISAIGMHVANSSGNISVAVYRNAGVGKAAKPEDLVATSGAVACPATGYQEVSLGSTVTVSPGDWLALSVDNTSATFRGVSSPIATALGDGRSRVSSSQHPLPDPAPPSPGSGMGRCVCLIGVA